MPDDRADRPTLPILAWRWAVMAAAPVAFGLWSLRRGQDANWDLRNYHFYNGHALLAWRYDLDIAPAGVQSFFNPLLDTAWFELGSVLPARALGLLLGALQAANFVLLYAIALAILPIARALPREAAAAALALVGACSAGNLGLLGTTMGDNIVSIGLLASLLIALAAPERLADRPLARAARLALLAGLPAGAAVALKLPAAAYAAGWAAAFLFLPARLDQRLVLCLSFTLGAAMTFALLDGFWMWHVWQRTGNPIFPYFNELFASPNAVRTSFRDLRWPPRGLLEALFYPVIFSANWRRISETPFTDYRILAAFVLVPAALLAQRLWRSDPSAPARGAQRFLVGGLAVAYLGWLLVFGYYRYAVTLEMLAPLAIAVAVGRTGLPRPARVAAVASIMLLLLVTTRPNDWGHAAWRHRFVEVAVPQVPRLDSALVLLADRPTAFVVSSFPPTTAFVQLEPVFGGESDIPEPWEARIRRRLAAQGSDLYTIFHEVLAQAADERLQAFGLRREVAACRPLAVNLVTNDEDLLLFCPVSRL